MSHEVDLSTFPEGFHSRVLAGSQTGVEPCIYSREAVGHIAVLVPEPYENKRFDHLVEILPDPHRPA